MILLVLVSVLIYVKYRIEMKDLKAHLIQNSQIVDLPSGRMEYTIYGEGKPVLISHGGAGGYDQGLITAKTHLEGDYKIIAVSRFGHLRSILPKDSNAMMQADAYAELLDHLGIERLPIIGTSGGGPSAIQFALRHPQKCSGLVLTCAVSDTMKNRRMGIYGHPFVYYLTIKYLKKLVLKQIGVTQEIFKKLDKDEIKSLGNLLVTMNPIELRRDGLYVEVEEWTDKTAWAEFYDLTKIDCPTLIIHAKDDSVVPYEMAVRANRLITQSDFLSLNDGGHLKLGHRSLIKGRTSNFINQVSEGE